MSLRKVQSGQPLVIPAGAYNTFIDAAMDYRRRTAQVTQDSQPSLRQADIVLVRNDSGASMVRSSVLGINAPIVLPSANLDEFKNRTALACGIPSADTHEGKFVVLAEPIAAGKIGRAFISGVCPVKVASDSTDSTLYTAGIADGVSTGLKTSPDGSASILWRAAGTGQQWALVRIGPRTSSGKVFPVDLFRNGGTQGTATTPASWKYDVTDPVTGETLATAVNPIYSPHKWQRPTVGQMIWATFGYAHYQDDGSGGQELVLGWINEMPDQEGC